MHKGLIFYVVFRIQLVQVVMMFRNGKKLNIVMVTVVCSRPRQENSHLPWRNSLSKFLYNIRAPPESSFVFGIDIFGETKVNSSTREG